MAPGATSSLRRKIESRKCSNGVKRPPLNTAPTAISSERCVSESESAHAGKLFGRRNGGAKLASKFRVTTAAASAYSQEAN